MGKGKKKVLKVYKTSLKCKVPSCQAMVRSDHVKEHYQKRVQFDKGGQDKHFIKCLLSIISNQACF